MKIWFNTHLQALKLVLQRMRANLISTLLIALVVGIAVSLPGLFYLAVDHAAKFSSSIQSENEISIFLDLAVSEDTINEIDTLLTNHPQVKQHRFISKQSAWEALQKKLQLSGDAQNNRTQDIDILKDNPLPDAFYVQAKFNAPETLDALKNELSQIPNVNHVLLNSEWIKQLATILAIAKKVILFIALLLAIALAVIIGNTIRMQILTQQDEIEVSYLIGATNSFIRTPFLYAGTLYGLFGGLVGIAIITFSIYRLNHYIKALSGLYQTNVNMALYDATLLGVIVLIAAVIGWLGAYLAVNRAIAGIIAAHKNRG